MSESKRLWREVEERDGDVAPAPEFDRPDATETAKLRHSRRDFLRAAGFTFAGAMLTGCSRAPVEKAIPYLIQPEGIIPGRSYFYSSTCAGCSAACGLLIKNRDGRPIKLEGNPQHPLSRGGLCAVGQASILGLYDSRRLFRPLAQGQAVTWEDVDQSIAYRLKELRAAGAVRFLTVTETSPTTTAAIQRFLKEFRDGRHVSYDALSSSAILDAHERTHGARVLPHYRFDRAEVIVSFDADFLGTWISPVEFARDYQAGRTLEGKPPRCSYHVQFESRMSLTGSRADRRFRISPCETGLVLTALAVRIADKSGRPFGWAVEENSSVPPAALDGLAERLWQAHGRSLVVSGAQEIQAQILVNFINHALGNYGAALDIERPSLQRQGNDRELARLLKELQEGKVATLFMHGVNPVFELPNAEELAESLKRVPLIVNFAQHLDETAAVSSYVCPEPHYLETWGDAEPVAGVVSIRQPAMQPFGKTRPLVESLARWTGAPKSAYDLLRERWRLEVFPKQRKRSDFEGFWEQALQDGYVETETPSTRTRQFDFGVVRPILKAEPPPAGAYALVLYPKVGMLEGRAAGNPWLQELPDPISKVTWDNYACVSPATATRLGVRDGDVVRLTGPATYGPAKTIELPAFIQPGQDDRTIAVALGYGSRLSERFAKVGPQWLDALPSVGRDGRVGKNTAPFLEFRGGCLVYSIPSIQAVKTGERAELASTQRQFTLDVPKALAGVVSERPPVVRATTLAEFSHNPAAGNPADEKKEDLWPRDHPYTGHRWAMVIDLNACTGCSACVVACQAENNIPVVGKDEARRKRQMQWIRLDRYYAGEGGEVDIEQQPMLCQQCENAPCESVCPVLATVHSAEGLNMQVYNRCVGTRYCANNCPYKARRFNWFDYDRGDKMQNLVLNPDVTVRSRGVMEKCTFCVQRIEAARIESKRQGREITDGEIQTACQQSCPAGAIVFGDVNDPNSRVSRLVASGRSYRVLEELNVKPSVHYLTRVRNREEKA